MAPNGRPRWKFSQIALAIPIALLVVLGITEYRHWASEQKLRRETMDAMFKAMNGQSYKIQASSFPAPPFDSNDVKHCFALNMAARRAVKQGLLDAQKAERLSQVFSKLPPLKTPPGTDEGAPDLTVILGRLLAADRLVDAGDRTSLATAVNRCTELISAKLTE